MEILFVIGLLYGFWPVILGSLIIIDAIIRSVYFWIVIGILVLWYLITYLYNKDKEGKDKK